jgi:hypothetical protein
MKQFLWLLFVLSNAACSPSEASNSLEKLPAEFVVDSNTVQIVGDIDSVSASDVLKTLRSAAPDQPLNVYIQTSNADVDVLQEIMLLLQNRNTSCFAGRVEGPGFSLLQSCRYRVVGTDTIGKPKRLTGNIREATASQIKIAQEKLARLEEEISGVEAARMGLKLQTYLSMIEKDIAGYRGYDLVSRKAADSIGYVVCKNDNEQMERTYQLLIRTKNNQVKSVPLSVVVSVCPSPRKLFLPTQNVNQVIQYTGLAIHEAAPGPSDSDSPI